MGDEGIVEDTDKPAHIHIVNSKLARWWNPVTPSPHHLRLMVDVTEEVLKSSRDDSSQLMAKRLWFLGRAYNSRWGTGMSLYPGAKGHTTQHYTQLTYHCERLSRSSLTTVHMNK